MKLFALTLMLAGTASAASISAQTIPTRSGILVPSTQRTRTDCTYSRTTNSVGDIIFGRTNDANCRDVRSREDGVWYQVGRGRDNNSIYERRVRDANGNLVIQHARRNPNGTFTILNTRVAGVNDKEWKKAQKEQRKAHKRAEKAETKEMKDRLKAGTITKDQYETWKRADKQQDKIDNSAMKENEKAGKEAFKANNSSRGKGKNK